jgi:hypothetical protein
MKQWLQRKLQSVPATWNQSVSSDARGRSGKRVFSVMKCDSATRDSSTSVPLVPPDAAGRVSGNRRRTNGRVGVTSCARTFCG